MATLRRLPPGRAGRMWLTRRLAIADRAAELLDQKVRVLRQQTERFRLLAERTGAEWTRSCREAEDWSLRAALVGGQAALRAATVHGGARVVLNFGTTMGVPHPSDARCLLPDAADPVTSGPATMSAVLAHRQALDAAVQHAVALAGLRALEHELAATRRRRRAITDRLIPQLEDAVAAAVLRLEETERAEGVRLRCALRAQQPQDGAP